MIKLPFVIKIFVLSIFEWPLKTGLTTGFTVVTDRSHGQALQADRTDKWWLYVSSLGSLSEKTSNSYNYMYIQDYCDNCHFYK